jgi:hypothetical protein
MIGRLYHFLYLLVVTLRYESGNGFQSNLRSSSRISLPKLLVSTTANSVSTNSDSTDESSSTSKPSKIDVDFKAYGNGYKTVFTEIPYADCEPSYGSIPTDLKGSYFRTGPGKRRIYSFLTYTVRELKLTIIWLHVLCIEHFEIAMFSAGSIAPPKTSIIQPRDGAPIP